MHIEIPISAPEILADLAVIKAQLGALMATQEQVNAVVARIDTALAGIRADIETIKAAHPDIDLSALESKVSDLEGLDAENPPPTPS